MKEKKLISFYGDPELKKKYVERAIAHRKADEIVQGQYWEDGKGCCIGCLAHVNTGAHAYLEGKTGVRRNIYRLADRIFEELTKKECKRFPEQLIKALPVRSDLSLVLPKFFIKLLKRSKRHCSSKGMQATEQIIKMYKNLLKGKVYSKEEWRAAAAAAAAADDAAAAKYAAKYAAAAAAADDAAAAVAKYAAKYAAAAAKYAADAADDAAKYAAAAAKYAAKYAADDAAKYAADARHLEFSKQKKDLLIF